MRPLYFFRAFAARGEREGFARVALLVLETALRAVEDRLGGAGLFFPAEAARGAGRRAGRSPPPPMRARTAATVGGDATPLSVTIAVMRRAGVMSNAGFTA